MPARYQEKKELERQRSIHDSLITNGLRLISQSYLDVFQQRCQEKGIAFESKIAEGKNYVGILQELNSDNYDLVSLGSLGLGATLRSLIGSVCERVVRKARTDVLVARENKKSSKERVVVAIDGSPFSYMALKRGLEIGGAFNKKVDVVSAFDPQFHSLVFNRIASVLSEEAGRTFRFKEQERLHEEIIDKGLEKLYLGYLGKAEDMARECGQEVSTSLLSGKPFHEVLGYLEAKSPWLLIVGRSGSHYTEHADIGSTAENLVRLAPCSVLVATGEYFPASGNEVKEHTGLEDLTDKSAIIWSSEAQQLIIKVPPFVRPMARKSIEDWARANGYEEITQEVMLKARESLGM